MLGLVSCHSLMHKLYMQVPLCHGLTLFNHTADTYMNKFEQCNVIRIFKSQFIRYLQYKVYINYPFQLAPIVLWYVSIVSISNRRLVGSTNQACSSGFNFRIAWKSTERPSFLWNCSMSVISAGPQKVKHKIGPNYFTFWHPKISEAFF